jgi:hypothetical protein
MITGILMPFEFGVSLPVYWIDHVGNRKVPEQTFFTDKKSSFPKREYDTSYIKWFCYLVEKIGFKRNKNNIY